MKNKLKAPKLTLIGAGPGDADLITMKGIRALGEAEVILYDALVNPELLDYCNERSLKIYVGKRAGRHSYSQHEINILIRRYAKSHRSIARLKGGDPFVFGRGWEELAFAAANGIEVEIVPGVSSALSIPALQQIPLTHRGISESFWVITGTTSHGILSHDVHLAARSKATVIILMGMRKIGEIMDLFSKAGRGDTSVAIIQNGSMSEEKVCIGTVASIGEKAIKAKMTAPAVIVIGNVVDLKSGIFPRMENKLDVISEKL